MYCKKLHLFQMETQTLGKPHLGYASVSIGPYLTPVHPISLRSPHPERPVVHIIPSPHFLPPLGEVALHTLGERVVTMAHVLRVSWKRTREEKTSGCNLPGSFLHHPHPTHLDLALIGRGPNFPPLSFHSKCLREPK